MTVLKSFEDLKLFHSDENEEVTIQKSGYKNHSKNIALTIGYLLGVKEEYLYIICESNDEFDNLKKTLEKNNSATAIRCLNNMRSNLMLGFKAISQRIRISSHNYEPLYKNEVFKDDFKKLMRLNIDITPANAQDINAYINKINDEIKRHFPGTKKLFPEWVNFKYIENIFKMPKDIVSESKKFQVNQECYPFKRYFNWEYPEKQGNILSCDQKILSLIYIENGETFKDVNKVSDVSDNVKYNIEEFIQKGTKVQVFIDGENTDPYRFSSMLAGLQDSEREKIELITVYYDARFSCKAWEMLKHFSGGIEVKTVSVERIIEDKSLVDHKLVAGVSKACYKERVDSIILASSDSDFWSVIEEVEANYLVLIENEKCSYDFKEKLRGNDVFYCYLERFMNPDDRFFKSVFRSELKKEINKQFQLTTANELLNSAITQSRADVSKAVRENLFNKYIKNLKLSIDKNGNFEIIIPE